MKKKKDGDDIISSPRAAFLIYIITQPRAVIILSLDPKYIQSYLRPSPSVVKLIADLIAEILVHYYEDTADGGFGDFPSLQNTNIRD